MALRKAFALLISVFVQLSLFAQEKPNTPEWDVNNPPGPYKEVKFTLSEGTWINLDVSPDGKWIVFDLLGDIYIMPSSGGTAKVLRQGYAYEVQPRFSPDGKKISFTSDAGGGDNIWVMNIDGSGARQVTKEDFRLLNNAVWTPDGNYLIARKHFTSTRSAGAGEMWMYHISGGNGLQLTKKKNEQQDAGEPFVAGENGKYLYFSEDMYPGGKFQYNKNPNAQIYVIRRLDMTTGEIENIVQGPGGAVRPVVSHDGKTLAFIRRVRDKSVLFLQNLETGEQWPVYDKLTKDQQEAWAIFGVYTNYSFTPDDKAIIIWSEGKIRRIDLATGSETVIPFVAESSHRITEALHPSIEAHPDSFTVKAIRHAVTSPNGKSIVFNAAGYLWIKDLPNGKAKRLTRSNDFEFEPTFSPDGRQLLYVTWNDTATGGIWLMDLARRSSKKLTTRKGIYRQPQFSPDGKMIVYQKEGGNDHQGFSHNTEPGIYVMQVNGSNPRRILKSGSSPVFSADGKRIFYSLNTYPFGALEKNFRSCDLNGKDERTHFTSKYAMQFTPSPDNNWIAFSDLHKVYVAPLITTGQAIDLNGNSKSYPVSQFARDAGYSLHWSADSKNLHWLTGEEYFTANLKDRFSFLANSPDSLPPLDTVGLKINLRLPSDKPSGEVALTNARIITMKGDEVIEQGTVLIRENRIVAVGKTGEVQIPEKAFVLDCSGKTLSPGFVDVHAHLGTFRHGLSPQKQWSYYANLAYGVTTTHDPSSNSEMVFSQSEAVKAGHMRGPRIFSTGTILYGAEGDFKAVINNFEDAKSALRRNKALGAFSVKSYNQPRRNQRQQVIAAARGLGMAVVPEGGSHFLHNMSMILDGHTGIEHNIPMHSVYDDVVKLWSSSSSGYTPTLIVAYGAVQGEDYWYQKTNVWEKEKLLRFTPRAVIDGRSRHRKIIPDDEWENGFIKVSKICKKLSDAGVKINLGGHGQLQGLGAHWELWMLQMGGMSNLEALRAATYNGAYYIGMDKDLGSLEPGKLADIIVFDKNPLDDIRNSESISYTIANGRIFDSNTMNEIGNHKVVRTPFYWEGGKFSNNFPFHEETQGFHQHQCGCAH